MNKLIDRFTDWADDDNVPFILKMIPIFCFLLSGVLFFLLLSLISMFFSKNFIKKHPILNEWLIGE